jgi:hypothetical protein
MPNHLSQGSHSSLSEFETDIASESAIWRQAEWGGFSPKLRLDSGSRAISIVENRCSVADKFANAGINPSSRSWIQTESKNFGRILCWSEFYPRGGRVEPLATRPFWGVP